MHKATAARGVHSVLRLSGLAEPRHVPASVHAVGDIETVGHGQAGLRRHALIGRHRNGDHRGGGIGRTRPLDERLSGIGEGSEKNNLAVGVSFEQGTDLHGAAIRLHGQSWEERSGVGRIGTFSKLGEIGNAIIVAVKRAALIGDVPEIGDFPRVRQAVAIGIELQQGINTGYGTERVAHDDSVGAKVSRSDIPEQE